MTALSLKFTYLSPNWGDKLYLWNDQETAKQIIC